MTEEKIQEIRDRTNSKHFGYFTTRAYHTMLVELLNEVDRLKEIEDDSAQYWKGALKRCHDENMRLRGRIKKLNPLNIRDDMCDFLQIQCAEYMKEVKILKEEKEKLLEILEKVTEDA